MLTTWYIFWNTKPTINWNCVLMQRHCDFKPRITMSACAECGNDLWKAVYRPGLGIHALILKKSFPENKFFICWFFATIVKLVPAMTLHKTVAENLFSFFHLPECFPSHPLLTTHLCLGFLLSPPVFKLFLLALSLSCHPKKQQVLFTFKCRWTSSGNPVLDAEGRFINYRLWVNKISQLSTATGYQGTQTLQNGHSQCSLLTHRPRSLPSSWTHHVTQKLVSQSF